MGGEKNKSEATMVKKIKVENWSSFLLQKLYHCYTQKKHCDFTLKMVDGTLKVHSVVMNACSNYFIQINLENSHSVTLPPELRKELMEPIVNFIYSGVLSFKANVQKDLVIASKILKIDILTKLIDTEDIMNDSKTFSHKTIPFEDAHIKERHFLSSGDTPTKFHSPSSHPGSSVIKSTGSSSLPSTPSTSGGVGKMAMKKLPFWKKRSTVPGASSSVSRPEDSEDVKPSRFELPEDACPNSSYFYIPDFDNPLSYESECIVKPDEKILKRVTQSAEAVTDSKKIKLIKSVVAHEDDMSGDEILPDDDYDDFDEYPPPIPSSATSVPTTPKPILKTDKFDSARKKSVRFSTPGDPSDESPNTTGEPPPSKPDPEETIITRKIVTIKEEQVDPPPLVISDPQRVVVAPSSSGQGSNNIHLSLNNPTELASIDPNHAKIIEEVLQKYPDLIHGNRNFKLKVVNSDNQIINYIMNNRNKCLTSGKKRSRKSLGPASVPGMMNNGPSSGAPPRGTSEQTTAHPFECKFCASSLAEPLPDYYTWRKHMEDVHSEKFDVRICEYCGLKLSKRNLYLYHLLRVHGIQNETMKFPECKFCNYIALTENLLYKHCKNVHNKLIGFVCSTCNIIFKTHDQLTAHMKHTEHGAEKKTHGCKYCGKQFDRSVNLKAHLRANHKSEADAETDLGGSVVVKEEPSSGQEVYEYVNQSQQYIEVPLVQNSGYGTLVLPGGVTIIDTNNARLAGDSSLGAGESLVPGQRGMQGHSGESLAPREAMHAQEAQGQVSLGGSEGLAPRDGGMQGQAMMAGAESLVPGEGMEAQGMIAGADGMMGDGSGLTGEATIEHNEAVLGTNECGQTVLILNGTQQYILEQQSDGRLILPDILANNCVISYAEETAPGGLEQSGEYEIINVDQTQEVLMAGHASQGILVSQVEHAPSTRRGVETLYGSHEGETILDSQESSNQLVLGSRRYDGTILTSGEPNGHTTHHSMSEHSMSGHAMEQPVMQAILTSTGGHEQVMSSVIQSTSSNSAILVSSQSSGMEHGTVLTSCTIPQDGVTMAGSISTMSGPVRSSQPLMSDPLSSATLSPASSEPPDFAMKSESRETAFNGEDYAQDDYDSEGGMVIDAPVESSGPEHDPSGGSEASSPPGENVCLDGKVTIWGAGEASSPPTESVCLDEKVTMAGAGEASSPPGESVCLDEEVSMAGAGEASSPPSESVRLDGKVTLAGAGEASSPSGESVSLEGKIVLTGGSNGTPPKVKSEKIQALEEEWDNLDEGEEEEDENEEEERGGPCRGEI